MKCIGSSSSRLLANNPINSFSHAKPISCLDISAQIRHNRAFITNTAPQDTNNIKKQTRSWPLLSDLPKGSWQDPRDPCLIYLSKTQIPGARSWTRYIPEPDDHPAYHIAHAQWESKAAERKALEAQRSRADYFIFGCIISSWLFWRAYNYLQEPEPIFNPPKFTSFTVVKKDEVSPTAFIITIQPLQGPSDKSESDPYKIWWEKGTWSVQVKQPELQIARSYTPLPPLPGEPDDHLRLLIRKEYKGEVSGYLHKMNPGSKIELRGPHEGVELPEAVSEVVFLAGGTGIAPALQVAHTLLERRTTGVDSPMIHIVWANRRREDCQGAVIPTQSSASKSGEKANLIIQELENLKRDHPAVFNVEYLIDEEGTLIDQKKLSQLAYRDAAVGARLLFVSGPEGFVNFIAGAKKWEDDKEGQGELGGILGKLGLRGWHVWKL